MAAMVRTFSSDIYDKMLSNPKVTGDQRLQLERMRSRRKTKEGEHELRKYMTQTMSRKNVLAAHEERRTLIQLKERKDVAEWDATEQLEAMQDLKMGDHLVTVQDEIAALKRDLGLMDDFVAPTSHFGASKVNGKYAARFAELSSLSTDAQAKRFLMVFVFEFQGRFEEVLDLCQEFKGFLREGENELEEDRAHLFLESRGETATVVELRNELKKIDIDCNLKISFIEFCFFKFNKSLAEYFDPPEGPPPQHLLDALDEAITWHTQHWDKRHTRDSMYEKLEADAHAESRVKSLRAKAQLKAERSRGWTQQWRAEEIHGAYTARKADKAVKNADKSQMMKQAVAEEDARMRKLEEAAAHKLDMERKMARARLKAKAAMWER